VIESQATCINVAASKVLTIHLFNRLDSTLHQLSTVRASSKFVDLVSIRAAYECETSLTIRAVCEWETSTLLTNSIICARLS
jgi:hypothetical protein